MSEPTVRPSLFLYTEETKIDAAARKEMIKAGFLPIKVSDLSAYRRLDAALCLPGELTERAALVAALKVIKETSDNTMFSVARTNFVKYLAQTLLNHEDREP